MQNIKAARQAAKHEPRHDFPVWGMESPHLVSTAREHYRNGDICAWCRYIIPPRDGLLWYGWTIGDTVTTLAVVAFMGLLVHAFCVGFDANADLMGW